MTTKDDTHSKHKQLCAELTDFHDQLHHLFVLNQFQRQLLFGWLQDHEHQEIDLLGFSLTDQWQCRREQQLEQTLGELRERLT